MRKVNLITWELIKKEFSVGLDLQKSKFISILKIDKYFKIRVR